MSGYLGAARRPDILAVSAPYLETRGVTTDTNLN